MLKYFTIGLICCAVSLAFGGNVTQFNRYATAENKPLKAQINPLLAVQNIHFPKEVNTVGDALAYWLHYSGFHLAETNKLPEKLKTLMQQPLPQVHRHLGPMSLKDGLIILVGSQVFSLIDNPLTREVNFKLTPKFQFLKGSKQ